MNPAQASIAPHIFFIALFLSLGWGAYLAYTIRDYRQAKALTENRRQGDVVAAMRRMVVAICVFALPFGFLLRTGLVLAGFGGDVAGQVLFFALIGTNIPGVIFALISLRYD